MDAAARDLVRWRADNRCDYCLLRQEYSHLTHPRRDRWAEHFVFRGPRIEGLTAMGRTTVHVLGMNDARRLDLRADLLARGELA